MDSDDPDGIAFCESETYLRQAENAGVGALLVRPGLQTAKPAIEVPSPKMAFGMLLSMVQRPLPLAAGIHGTAVVDPGAKVSDSASIGAFAVIERGATVEDGARIYPFCYVGENCSVGRDCVLYPHVVLYQDVTLGDRCILHSGTVLGADGFGFVWDGKRQMKVPQVGSVHLAEEVELGANTAVDRATAGTTRIGKGTKLDNLIQVAHNVEIGEHGVIAAQTAIGGSTKIGDRFAMGGQGAIADHITIADDVVVGGSSGVSSDLPESGTYFGRPAIPAKEGVRSYMAIGKLPSLLSRVRALEKKVAEMEKKGE